jgi:hypothetical protein
MREIRTYGLMRGRWSVRLARRTGAYSTHAAKRERRAEGRSAAPRRWLIFVSQGDACATGSGLLKQPDKQEVANGRSC